MPRTLRARFYSVALTLAASGISGCEAPSTSPDYDVGVAGSGATGGTDTSGPTPPGFLQDGADRALRATPLRRLTRSEYRNTVREVLGVEPPSEFALPEDSLNAGFTSTVSQLTTIASANRYLDAAITVGERLLPTISQLIPCDVADGAEQRSCLEDWLTSYGTRLFRRPLREDEIARFVGAFERTRAKEDYEQAASVLVEALLVSPELLFIELPSGGEPLSEQPLDSWQVAARLSLLLWDSIPDAELLDAAAQDRLSSPAELTAQVERMLRDERTRQSVRSFFDDWLGLRQIAEVGSDPNGYPVVPRERAAELAEETRAYAEDVFWEAGGLSRLFVSTTRFRSPLLSRYYGDELAQAPGLARYEAEITDQSFGLLSQAGFLMTLAHSEATSPIQRGAFVRRKLLCGRLPPAPPGLATPLPMLTPGVSKRQGITEHTSGAVCQPCHGKLNDLGFALEQFDIAGAFHDTERGVPLDVRASFDEAGLRASVNGARELSQALASSATARACALQKLYSFALEREPTSADQAEFDELGRRFESSGFDLKALLVELVSGHEFQTRIEPGDPR